MKRLVILLLVFVSSIHLNAQTLEEFTWLSVDYPPQNFRENGIPTGIGVDVLTEIWKRVGLKKQEIKFLPWARGYRILQNKVGTSLFSMAMSEQRKKKFKFVGPYLTTTVGIIAKKSKGFKINSVDDLLNFYPSQSKKRIGIVRGANSQQLLLKQGYPIKNLNTVVRPDQLIGMIDMDRLSAIAIGYHGALWKMKALGIDSSQYELIYTLKEAQVGFGFHINTDPRILERLQKALEELRKDGTLEEILRKYQG